MKVEGLDFYYLKGAAVTSAGCMFEFDMGTDAVEGRQRVCIGADHNREEAGKFTYGQTTIGVHLTQDAYEDLKAMYEARTNDIAFCVALGDGTTAPTHTSGNWTAASRSILSSKGYIQSVQWGSEDNGLWQATFIFQRQAPIKESLK